MREPNKTKDVCRREKNGKAYFQFAVRDPRTAGKWKSVHVSKKRLEAYGLKPTGRSGQITEQDALVLKRLVERQLVALVQESDARRNPSVSVGFRQ